LERATSVPRRWRTPIVISGLVETCAACPVGVFFVCCAVMRAVAPRGVDEGSKLTGKLTTEPFFILGNFGKSWEVTVNSSHRRERDDRALYLLCRAALS
jgi:hypothetical protein